MPATLHPRARVFGRATAHRELVFVPDAGPKFQETLSRGERGGVSGEGRGGAGRGWGQAVAGVGPSRAPLRKAWRAALTLGPGETHPPPT